MKLKLYTRCSKCRENINYYSWETTRANLEMQKGRFLKLKCKQCGHVGDYHLNDLRAEKSNIALIISFLILVVIIPLVFFFFWRQLIQNSNTPVVVVPVGVIIIPFIMYGLMVKDERKKINSFNQHKIKE